MPQGVPVYLRILLTAEIAGINLDKNTMTDIYKKFGLEAGTQDFIGHAMALHLDDE